MTIEGKLVMDKPIGSREHENFSGFNLREKRRPTIELFATLPPSPSSPTLTYTASFVDILVWLV